MQSRMNLMLVVAAAAVLLHTAGLAQATLIAHWTFDEASGQVAYDSAGSHDGQLGSTTDPDANDPTINQTGKIGAAYSFDGAVKPDLDYVSVPTQTDLGGMQKLTLTAWFFMSETTSVDRYMMYKLGNSGDRSYYMCIGDGGTNMFVNLRGPGSTNIGEVVKINVAAAIANGDLLLNAWQHLACAYDGSTREGWVWLNGKQMGYKDFGTGSVSIGPSTTTPLRLGCHRDLQDGWKGGLDDLGILDEALNFGKAKSLYTTVTDAGLAYDLGNMYKLFGVYDTAGSKTETIGTLTWEYATGLAGGEGNAWSAGGSYFIQLDAAGNGVKAVIPEPSTLLLLYASLLGLLCYAWRKRK